MLKTVALALITLTCLKAFSIIDGRLLNASETKKYRAYVTLTDGETYGGGVHIGQGLILTAAHVFNGFYDSTAAYTTKMNILNNEGALLTSLIYYSNQVTNIEPTSTFVDANNLAIQIPDLAILIPPTMVRQVLIKSVPVAKWKVSAKDLTASHYTLIGVGDIEFAFYKELKFPTPNKVRPKPLLGKFCSFLDSKQNSPDTLSTIYKTGCSAGGSGDSGSPLWSLNAANEPIVVAVTHTQLAPDQTDNGIGETVFSRLDSAAVQTWIQSILEKNPYKK